MIHIVFFICSLLGRIYFQDNPFYVNGPNGANLLPGQASVSVGPGKLPININAAVSGVALCGTLAGQIFWGYVGDILGRKFAYGLTLAIMIMAGVGQVNQFFVNLILFSNNSFICEKFICSQCHLVQRRTL